VVCWFYALCIFFGAGWLFSVVFDWLTLFRSMWSFFFLLEVLAIRCVILLFFFASELFFSKMSIAYHFIFGCLAVPLFGVDCCAVFCWSLRFDPRVSSPGFWIRTLKVSLALFGHSNCHFFSALGPPPFPFLPQGIPLANP